MGRLNKNTPAKGRARHPHDSKRPEPAKVRKAVEKNDIDALKIALTPRQRAFAREYTVDFVGTSAALRAGYSPNNVNRTAYLLLRHKGVRAYIDHLLQSRESKVISLSPEWVLNQITSIITKEDAKDSDKLRGLEALARHLGMFIDRTEITGKDGEAIAIHNQRVEEDVQDFTHKLKQLSDRAEKEKPTVN